MKASKKKNLDDLVVVGEIGEREKSHQKKVQKVNELIEMRIERKIKIKEFRVKTHVTVLVF
jgi:hypothetical protein